MDLWRTIQTAVSRFFPSEPVAAASGGRLLAVKPGYPTMNSMSALAAFPWVWACVNAISSDLAGLPLIAVKTVDGKEQILSSHPVIDLLNRPNPQQSGFKQRRQTVADQALSGNAYTRVIRSPVLALCRLHPHMPEVSVDPFTGMIYHFELKQDDKTLRLPYEDVLHFAGLSWSDDATQILGESAVRCLHDGLTVDKSSREQAGNAARRGRLEMLLAPNESTANLGKNGVKAIKDQYIAAVERGDGLFVLSKSVSATPLSLSPRELEFSQLHSDVRDEILAVFGVPEVRVGGPSANYGTARQQMRMYWESLRLKARLFEDEWSRLCTDGARIRHDFSSVEALQVSYTERQTRASVWVTAFGADPKEAATYEGFPDAPIPADQNIEDLRAPRRPASEVVTPQALGLVDLITAYLEDAADRYQVCVSLGSVPEFSRQFERVTLTQLIPEDQASEVVGLLHEVAEQAIASELPELRTLNAFGRIHAEQIAEQITELAA